MRDKESKDKTYPLMKVATKIMLTHMSANADI